MAADDVEDPQKRTPFPSDFEHGKLLMARNFRKDLKKPFLYAARVLIMPGLFVLWTIGIFMSYQNDTSDDTIAGNFRIFEGETWRYPSSMKLAGFNATFVESVSSSINSDDISFELLAGIKDPLDLEKACDSISPFAQEEICVYFNSTNEYTLYYGGKYQSTPFQSSLAAAQYVIDKAILETSDAYDQDKVIEINMNQRTPLFIDKESNEPPLVVTLVTGLIHSFTCAFMLIFLVSSIAYEKLNDVTRSFLLVGVKMRTYLLQWVVYHSMNSILIAGIMTIVWIYWRVVTLSNAGLLFVSHYFGLVQINALFVLLMQFIETEELASGIPFLTAIFSCGIGSAIIVLVSWDTVILTILTVFNPFFGIIQYNSIYCAYDVNGYDIGIQPGNNFAESGLLGNMIAQIVGIVFWISMILLYASPKVGLCVANMVSRRVGTDLLTNNEVPDPDNDSEPLEELFETLPPKADVLVSVRNMGHTYYPGLFNCIKKKKPTEVIKGLDMDICRGEVFGYLGHNGAGKTTSVHILAAELMLQGGNVTYHFKDGNADLSSAQDSVRIRSKIGLCPQHNTSLQNDLTAREYIRLFAHLKGCIPVEDDNMTVIEAVEAEVNRRLGEVKFTSGEDADKPLGTFSGGMKRKVLIAIALIGNPEVVFLDEPTAGLDPYNRRTIWDMIIAAKKGRSIILTTHFLDEADVLSDRIGIIKNGKLITCGSSLFLKHQSGVGYTLTFEAEMNFDVKSIIASAENMTSDIGGTYKWRLKHGCEPDFPQLLSSLASVRGKKVTLELTSLEQVFLESGKEDDIGLVEETDFKEDDVEADEEQVTENKSDFFSKIWKKSKERNLPGFWKKIFIVMQFIGRNTMKMSGSFFLIIIMPLAYLVAAVVISKVVKLPEGGQQVTGAPILITPDLLGTTTSQFFIDSADINITLPSPLELVNVPQSLDPFGPGSSIIGGYHDNKTLQYERELSSFALQIGTAVTSSVSASNIGIDPISTSVKQLPYVSDEPFRIDLLLFPMFLSFGFVGTVYSVLDVLLLKGDNTIALFRVAGITEWTANLGITTYKATITFLPFFVLLLILGFSLQLSFMGNGGRWLGTIFLLLAYLYSVSPIGLLLGKKFIHGNFKSVANWFPGVYMTGVSLPYTAWSMLYQIFPDEYKIWNIIGDILSIFPPLAFQRGLYSVMSISKSFKDDSISWGSVWSFESRIWFTILLMLITGSIEWFFLYRMTTARLPKTKLSEEEKSLYGKPLNVSNDIDKNAEREISFSNDEGINARDLVKVFRIKPSKDAETSDHVIKQAVKGVSYGIRKNEIFALLGPNGAGKTVTMSILAGEYAPEYGDVALDGRTSTGDDTTVDHLYKNGLVGYCPQFDALFEKQTVEEHLKFYSTIRGIRWNDESTRDHINAIVKLLGLQKYRNKEASQLSGGYKRRLSLALCMVGSPNVMMVDEITTGLDPGARRLIWDVLKPPTARDDYDVPAILLSSHYMDECQELGTRIGIMIDGEISATGSLERLQTLYCHSYFVEISMLSSADEDYEDRVVDSFVENGMNASLYESLPFHFKLQVPFSEGISYDETQQLSVIFKLLEAQKEKLNIKFYSVTMMNLEQIFINLSRSHLEKAHDVESDHAALPPKCQDDGGSEHEC